MDSQVMIGAGLPPIPAKLVSKIEAGEFVDMAELLPDRFGIAKSRPGDESARPSKNTSSAQSPQSLSGYSASVSTAQSLLKNNPDGYLTYWPIKLLS